jgi:hypothetical protein
VAAVAGATETACLTVGRVGKAPSIDGRLSPNEWDTAAATSCFLAAGGEALAAPGTVAFVQYDERALYIAFRCAEPDRDRPRAWRRAHDDRAFEDDSVQVFLAPEDLGKAGDARIAFGGYAGAYDTWYRDIAAYFEFTVNAAGSRTEARNDVRDWGASWAASAGREPGAWTAEFAIPFPALGAAGPPEGALWGLNLFRVRQPDASGWVFPPFGGYRPTPLGAVRFGGETPVVRQTEVVGPAMGANPFALQVWNPRSTETAVGLTVTPDGGTPAGTTAVLAAGSTERLGVSYSLAGHGSLRASYAVQLQGDPVPLLSGYLPLRRPAPQELELRYYALPGLVEGLVRTGPDTTAAGAVLALHSGAGSPAEAAADLSGRPGQRLRLPVAGQPGERFQARLRALDAAGQGIAERTIEGTIPARPAWLGTQAGLPLGVLPPWTPIALSDKRLRMLGKELAFGDLALPSAIRSAGLDLLAEPIRLRVTEGGKPVRWGSRTCRRTEEAPDHVRIESLWRTAALELRVTADLEYDGFCWTEIALRPLAPVTVDGLALEVPLRAEVAQLVYEGHAQSAHALSPCGQRGRLLPNLWLGNEHAGLAFLAESLDWVQASDRGRQVEIVPGRRSTLWRSTFIDAPTRLSAPYTAAFALHITPAKPVSLRKNHIFHGAYYGIEDAVAGGTIELPAKGTLDYAQGALECWVKPTFDPGEVYDPAADRSRYNRVFLHVTGSAGENLILYYNADDRSLRVVTRNAAGQYPVVMGSPAKLPAGQWSYVGLSWGEVLRLNLNGTVVETKVRGSVAGDPAGGSLHVDLASFQLDELRIAGAARPLEGAPSAPFGVEADTRFLHRFEHLDRPEHCVGDPAALKIAGCSQVAGQAGSGVGSLPVSVLDRLAAEGKRVVIFHENWARYQGYPDLEQTPKLRRIADACHARGMLFLVYFCQLMSDAAPEWQAMSNDFMALPERFWYHRDDVKQDCAVACVNGPYGDLLLDGIARLADEAGIDGVYMDGTTVPWDCANPTHPGCAQYRDDGTYAARWSIRATRHFMKRLRNIFAQRRQEFFLDAHTGGAICSATQSFCDGYYDGETLARYKEGFRLSPDTFRTAYTGAPFGFRGEFLPNRHTMDQALAIALVNDTTTRGQPAAVDLALREYEDAQTTFVPYWEDSRLCRVEPPQILGSVYLKPDRALLVLGSQADEAVSCHADLGRLLRRLPPGATARDPISGKALTLTRKALDLDLAGRGWQMVEVRAAP